MDPVAAAPRIIGWLPLIAIVITAALIGFIVRGLATLAATAIQASVSREREFLADASSVQITRNPAGLIAALAKADSGGGLAGASNTRHLWFVSPLGGERTEGWLATHPSIDDRIERLQALGAALHAGAPATDPQAAQSSPG